MRKVGQRIIFALQILERQGPSNSSEIAMHMDFVDKVDVSTYLKRSVKYGLATADKVDGKNMYTVIDGWRDNLHRSKRHPAKKTIKTKAVKPMINSVWALASL